MNIFRVTYLMALVAAFWAADVSPAAVAQQEVKQEQHKRGKYSDARAEKKYKKELAITVEPRKRVAVSPKELRLQQQEDTPIIAAIRAHNLSEVERLVKTEHVDLGFQNRARQTPLMIAAGEGDLPITQILVAARPGKINVRDRFGDTALLHAIRAGHRAIVEFLLNKGANPTLENEEKYTPLMLATHTNNTDIMKLLLDRIIGPNNRGHAQLKKELDRVDIDGNTASQIAARWKAQEAQDLLTKYAAPNVDAIKLIEAAARGDEKEVDALLANKVNVNYFYADRTPLIAALQGAGPQAIGIVKKLINAGADINAPSGPDGRTPLMMAFYYDNIDIAQWLLSERAEVNTFDKDDNTALMFFATSSLHDDRYLDCLDMLLKAGAYVSGHNRLGKTARAYAQENKSVHQEIKDDVIETLGQYNSETEMWDALVVKDEKRALLILQQYKLDVSKPYEGRNMLAMAAIQGLFKVAEQLILNYSVDFNFLIAPEDATALMLAAQLDNVKMVDLLLSYGADPQFKNKRGEVALNYAKKESIVYEIIAKAMDARAKRQLSKASKGARNSAI